MCVVSESMAGFPLLVSSDGLSPCNETCCVLQRHKSSQVIFNRFWAIGYAFQVRSKMLFWAFQHLSNICLSFWKHKMEGKSFVCKCFDFLYSTNSITLQIQLLSIIEESQVPGCHTSGTVLKKICTALLPPSALKKLRHSQPKQTWT